MVKNVDWRTFVSWALPSGILIGLSYFFILTVAGQFALVPQFLRTVGSLTAFLVMFLLGGSLVGIYEFSKSWISSDAYKRLFYLHDPELGYLPKELLKNWFRVLIGGFLFFIPFMYFAAVNNRFFSSIPMRGQSALDNANILHNTIFPSFTENIWAGFSLGILLVLAYLVVYKTDRKGWFLTNVFLLSLFVFDFLFSNQINFSLFVGTVVALLAANVLYFTGNKDWLFGFLSLVVVPYLNGRYVWGGYHNFAYGNDDLGKSAVYLFGIVGSLLVVATGTFILWFEWHLTNNFFLALKMSGYLASDFTLPLLVLVWAGFAYLFYLSFNNKTLKGIGG